MRVAILSLVGLASAAPSLLARQNTDYGFWNTTFNHATGRPGWEKRDLTAWYYRGELRATTTCHYSFVPQGTSPPAVENWCKDNQGTTLAAEQFSYSFGGPWSKSSPHEVGKGVVRDYCAS
jgi:hypothetical protein